MTNNSSSLTRVLFVNHTGAVSGAEKVLLQMVRGIDRERFHVGVLCPAEGPLQSACEELGIEVATICTVQARFSKRAGELLHSLRSILQAVRGVREEIAKFSPDLLHANTVRAGIVTTIASIGTKTLVVWHVHDILPQHAISTGLRAFVLLSRRTHALCVSNATAKAFLGGWPFHKRVAVLYNGVALSRFPDKHVLAPGPRDQSLRAELRLRPGDFLFCAVGQIAPRKGLHELIEAFALVHAANDQARLAIVGEAVFTHDQQYQESLLLLCRKRELQSCVTFVGSRKDVPSVMRSADTIVLNSHQEPFGLVLIEAMSSGTAVIATSVGGIPEIVTDKVTGWLVPSRDITAMAARMLWVLDHRNQLTSVQEAAQEEVCPRFSQERFLDGLHRYYSGLNLPRRPNVERGSSLLGAANQVTISPAADQNEKAA